MPKGERREEKREARGERREANNKNDAAFLALSLGFSLGLRSSPLVPRFSSLAPVLRSRPSKRFRNRLRALAQLLARRWHRQLGIAVAHVDDVERRDCAEAIEDRKADVHYAADRVARPLVVAALADFLEALVQAAASRVAIATLAHQLAEELLAPGASLEGCDYPG